MPFGFAGGVIVILGFENTIQVPKEQATVWFGTWYSLKEYSKMNPFQRFLKYCPRGSGVSIFSSGHRAGGNEGSRETQQ